MQPSEPPQVQPAGPTPEPPQTNWTFDQDTGSQAAQGSPAQTNETIDIVEWTASEYIAHDKNALWYISLIILAAIVAALSYWVTSGDLVTVAIIGVVALLFGVSAARKPRIQQYVVDSRGINIGNRRYEFTTFKSFSLIEEGAIRSLMLSPLKRFMPPISMYYPPDQEHQIMEALAAHLPFEPREHDPLDRLMQRLRF